MKRTLHDEDETATLRERQSRRIGSYQMERGSEEFTLRLDNQGDISLKGCLLFAFTMVCILMLGILAVAQTAQAQQQHRRELVLGDPTRLFEPQQNHFGFLWLVATILILVGIPFYVRQAYKSPLCYTFLQGDGGEFLRNGRRVTRFSRIEYLLLRETKDADGRYLYLLDISYNDGLRMMLYNGYDDREIMNLANEISRFVGCRVKWK